MPRAKPGPTPQVHLQPAIANGVSEGILTQAEVAVYLRLSEADVLRLSHQATLIIRNTKDFVVLLGRVWESVSRPVWV